MTAELQQQLLTLKITEAHKSLTWGAVEQQTLPRGHDACKQLRILSEKMQVRIRVSTGASPSANITNDSGFEASQITTSTLFPSE